MLAKRSTQSWLNSSVLKCKCIQVKFKKHNKMANQVSSWILVSIKPSALMKDITSCFNGI